MGARTRRRVREAAAASAAGALQRGGAEGEPNVQQCPTCGGTGKAGNGQDTCPRCGGKGIVAAGKVKEGRLQPPPNLRQSTSAEDEQPEHECGTCLMYDRGVCWGYGNFPVDGEWVCDSWKLDPNYVEQDAEQDLEEVPQPGDTDMDPTVCPACLTAECGIDNGGRLREADLSTDQRKGLGKDQFAVPAKAPGSGSYPIPDEAHARNALARVAQHGSPEEQAQVKAAVGRKFPNIGDGKTKESGDLETRLASIESLLKGLREGTPEHLNRTFAPMTQVTNSHGEKGYEVTLIREGHGNQSDGNWYTADAIREMCESGRAEGMQAYSNHPTLTEEDERPERDVKELIGKHTDVRFAQEAGKPASAMAVFVPVTTDEHHPHYGWVTTLAEAATRSRESQPLVGWSLYGLSAGDEGKRPDGSEGRNVSLIMPTSGDMVTTAGAGGEFARKLMVESARRLRRAATPTPQGASSMKREEFKSKLAEATKNLREAGTDDERSAAMTALSALEQVEIDIPTAAPESIEALSESAPRLVAKIKEAAMAEAKESDGDLRKQLEDAKEALREAQGTLGAIGETAKINEVLREAKVPEGERKWYVDQCRVRNLKESADILDFIETQTAKDSAQAERVAQQLREAAGLEDGVEIEGIFARVPAPPEDGGLAKLAEHGIPTIKVA